MFDRVLNRPLKKVLFLMHLLQEKCRRVAKGGEVGEDSSPIRLKQVQFVLNRKHAFFDAIP